MQQSILDWPEWAERTPAEDRVKPSKFKHGWRRSKRDLRDLMEKMQVDKWYIEDVTGSGGDPGVIVRWESDGVPHAICCDKYTTKGGNLREAYQWLKHEDRNKGRPVETGRDAFAAAQLPGADEDAIVVPSEESAYDVLDLDPGASEDEIMDAYRERVKEVHPDTGDIPDVETFKRVQSAKDTLMEGGK